MYSRRNEERKFWNEEKDEGRTSSCARTTPTQTTHPRGGRASTRTHKAAARSPRAAVWGQLSLVKRTFVLERDQPQEGGPGGHDASL